MTASDIKSIAFNGGNIILDAKDYSILEIKSIAFTCKSKRVTLTIKNAKQLSLLDCKSIAFANPGNVTFDFTSTK